MTVRRISVLNRSLYGCALGLLLLCAACSGPGASNAVLTAQQGLGPAADLSELQGKFALNVLPESFTYGSRGGQFELSQTVEDGAVVVRVNGAGLMDLRAFYAELSYPAGEYAPISATAQLGADAEQALSLARLDRPGVVELGAVLKHCDKLPGLGGQALLATLRFKARPAGAPRQVSAASVLPPCLDDSRPPLGVNCTDGTVEWQHQLPGDYNQNGHVGMEDLTPLAIHWGELPYNTQDGNAYLLDSIQDVIDANNDLQIGLGDLTAIGAHMGNGYAVQIEQFRLYRSLTPATDMPQKTGPHGWDSPSTLPAVNEVAFSTALGNPAQERLHFSVVLPDAMPGMAYWVRPRAGGTEGAPSNYAVNDPLLAGAFVLEVEPVTTFVGGAADISLDVVRRQSDVALEVWARNAVGLQVFSVNIVFDGAVYNPEFDLRLNLLPQLSQASVVPSNFSEIPGRIYCSNQGDNNYTDSGFSGDLRLLSSVVKLASQPGAFMDRVHNALGPQFDENHNAWSPGHIYGLAYDPLSQELSWYYYSVGDYDQDGNVLSDDLIPLGYHLGADGPFNVDSVEFLLDVSYPDFQDHTSIGIEDMQYVGGGLLKFVDSYNVYSVSEISAVPVVDTSYSGDPGIAALDNLPFTAAIGDPMTQRLRFTYHVDSPVSGEYLWVQTSYKGEVGAAGYNCYVQVP